MASQAVTRALAPLRRGRAGELREIVRLMLLRLMEFGPDDFAQFPPGRVPSYFGRRPLLDDDGEASSDEAEALTLVAQDGLLELGYEAAAVILGNRKLDHEFAAREALKNLEAGPPSVWLVSARSPWSGDAVFSDTVRLFRSAESAMEYLVARKVSDPRWWSRYMVGGAVYDKSGQISDWDPSAGYTFQRRGPTLEDVLSAQYGGAALTEEITPRRRGRRRRQ